MTVSQHSSASNGTSVGIIIVAGLGLAVVGALWLSAKVTALVVSGTPAMPFVDFLRTLWYWNSSVAWGTTLPIPHPLFWHWLSATTAFIVFVLEVLIVYIPFGLRRAHLRGKKSTLQTHNPALEPPPGNPNNPKYRYR